MKLKEGDMCVNNSKRGGGIRQVRMIYDFIWNYGTKIAINLAIKPNERTKPPLTKCQKNFNSQEKRKFLIDRNSEHVNGKNFPLDFYFHHVSVANR